MSRMFTMSPTQHSPSWSRKRMRKRVRSEKARNIKSKRLVGVTVLMGDKSPAILACGNIMGGLACVPTDWGGHGTAHKEKMGQAYVPTFKILFMKIMATPFSLPLS